MIEQIPAKAILQKVSYDSSKWFGIDYNMNLYRGCCHGCIYCDSRSNCYRIDDFDRVRVKKDASAILRRELKGKRKKGVVGIGAMSDTYNPFEKELCVTRQALKLLADNGFGVAIPTKSTLITRDIDILQQMNQYSPVIAKITITCAEDDTAKLVEPYAATSSERFSALAQLSDAGIFAGVLMMPILPFINDNERNLRGIVRRAKDAGAGFVSPSFGLTLRENQRDFYYDKLKERWPGLDERYRRTYGEKYSCDSPKAKSLYYAFCDECVKQGMLYRMEDIISFYKQRREPHQMAFMV